MSEQLEESGMFSRSFIKNAALSMSLVASLAPFGAANAEDDVNMLRVYLNHARVLKLDRPVAKVIVGNSDVADAAVADANTIVLTGHAFGTTNIVLLDSQGNAILDERILVSIDEGNTVRMYRQTERTVLSCTPNCEEHAELTSDTASSGTAK